jgi:hypothetical protein
MSKHWNSIGLAFYGVTASPFRHGPDRCADALRDRPPKGKGRAAERHYSTMSDAEIASLPVADLMLANAAVLLWRSSTGLCFALCRATRTYVGDFADTMACDCLTVAN